jgi:hypothetical protein
MEGVREGSNRRSDRGDGRREGEGGNVEDGGRRGGEKRTVDQRSPDAEEERRNRQRLDEFEIGTSFGTISDKMKEEVKKIITGLNGIEGGDGKEIIKYVVEGLKTMVVAVEATMTEMGDAVADNRKGREEDKKETDERLRKMEEKVRNNEVRMEADRKARETERKKESIRDMEDKLRVAGRQIKLMDMDFGKALTNRRDIIDRALDNFKEDVNLSNRKRLDILIRRTRVIVLGKETSAITIRGKSVHTVPILLECRNVEDKEELAGILREAEYYGSFHWPLEMMDVVKGIREGVRRMGYNEERQYIRIRPEERDGKLQVRADVKDKNGGRFWPVATWGIPPMDRDLRGPNDLVAKWQRSPGRV